MADQLSEARVLTGGIHATDSVSVAAEIELSRWSARKLLNGDVISLAGTSAAAKGE